MNIQAVIFDTDGVVVQRSARFSDRYAEDFGVAPGVFADFFANEFQQCLIGKADLKEAIRPYLPRWGWEGSVDELLEYWFSNEGTVNEDVLAYVKELRESGIPCYVTTSNERYRSDYLFNTLGLADHFDGAYASYAVGHLKSEQAFWEGVHRAIGVPSKERVIVWDDDQENVEVARAFGFLSYLFTGFGSMKNEMEMLRTQI